MSSLQSRIEQAKLRISSYFTPPPPAQEDSFGSGFIGLVDYFTYEGADVRDILDEITLVIADALIARSPRLEAREEDGCITISYSHVVYLNLTWRVKEEWHKGSPRAESLSERIYFDLKQQFRESSNEPL